MPRGRPGLVNRRLRPRLIRMGPAAYGPGSMCKGLILGGVNAKKNLRFESSQFEALNEVYLQNFLNRWVVNRETNLMMLINP